MKSQRLGQFNGRAGAHAQIARERKQRLLILVLGLEQSLLVIGQAAPGRGEHLLPWPYLRRAYLGPASAAWSSPSRATVPTSRARLQPTAHSGRGAAIARTIRSRASCSSILPASSDQLAGLQRAVAGEIDNILLRVNAEIVVGERPDYIRQRESRNRDAKRAQIAVLIVGIEPASSRAEATQPTSCGFAHPRLPQHAYRPREHSGWRWSPC